MSESPKLEFEDVPRGSFQGDVTNMTEITQRITDESWCAFIDWIAQNKSVALDAFAPEMGFLAFEDQLKIEIRTTVIALTKAQAEIVRLRRQISQSKVIK